MIKPHLPDHLNLFSIQQHVQYNLSALVSPFPLAHCGHSSQWFPSSTLQTLWDAAAVLMLERNRYSMRMLTRLLFGIHRDTAEF